MFFIFDQIFTAIFILIGAPLLFLSYISLPIMFDTETFPWGKVLMVLIIVIPFLLFTLFIWHSNRLEFYKNEDKRYSAYWDK